MNYYENESEKAITSVDFIVAEKLFKLQSHFYIWHLETIINI